jgi:2-haloacid dehalogenase
MCAACSLGERMGTVRVAIFDLGGVLIDWNPRHLYRKLFDGDALAMEAFLTDVCSPEWNVQMDAGKPFADGVAELVARHPHERERIEAYFGRWIEMIGGPISGTVAILEELHARGTPLFALSNWSAETFALVRNTSDYAFLDHFQTIFLSGELRLIKPDPAIFRHALEGIGAPADACVFIDDNEKNVLAARSAGMAGHRFTDPESLREDLGRLGLLS